MPAVDRADATSALSSRSDGGGIDSGSADRDVLITYRFELSHGPVDVTYRFAPLAPGNFGRIVVFTKTTTV